MTARLPSPELTQAALDGRPGAVDDLARAWLPHVYRWCQRLGGPGFDAEDAAHEVLILMCRKIDRIESPPQFPAWLFATSRKVIANTRRLAWFRKWIPGARLEQVADGPGPYGAVEARQAATRVWAVLAALSEAHREVLVLCELEERSASEAAELLNVPVGTVKSRLRAARVAFRGHLDALDADVRAARAG